MPAVSVKIEGLRELEEKMLTMATKDARKAMRGALRVAGKWMSQKIAERAPVDTGYLKAHIVSKIKLSAKEDSATVEVGPNKDAYYATWVEFGSSHNRPPKPFIRPAFEENKESWLEQFHNALKAGLGL